jgi:hypothetical protein
MVFASQDFDAVTTVTFKRTKDYSNTVLKECRNKFNSRGRVAPSLWRWTSTVVAVDDASARLVQHVKGNNADGN